MSRHHQATASVLALAASITCTSSDMPDAPDAGVTDSYDRTALLDNVVSSIILPLYRQFETDAVALSAAVDAYCAAVLSQDASATLEAARGAWSAAMATWERAELTQLGPTGAGGAALRDVIYSWPIVSACVVDREVVALHADPDSYDITTRLSNRRGLDAIEYLLFAASLEHSCGAAAPPQGWDTLDDDARRAARCAYAGVAAADVSARAAALVAAWDGTDGFGAALIAAGTPGSELASAHAGVDAVFGALFYLDTFSKDLKLAAPLGLRANTCSATAGTPCAADFESPYAAFQRASLEANLAGFRAVFAGGDGEGFDDFLRARGAGALADDTLAALDVAAGVVAALDPDFGALLAADRTALEAAHGAIREVTNRLKSDIPDTLNLTIPAEVGGDTD